MAEKFSLDELKNNESEATQEEVTVETEEKETFESVVKKVKTAQQEERSIEEVDAYDILPPKEHEPSESDVHTAKLFGDLDAAIDRMGEKITTMRQEQKEEEEEQKYMEELEREEMDTEATSIIQPTEKSKEDEDLDIPAENEGFDLSIEEEDFFKDLEDEDKETEIDQQEEIKEIKEVVKQKITPIVKSIDLGKFTIASKPVSVTKLLSNKTPNANVSDWVLLVDKKPISISEFSGPEIEKLDPRNSSRNRLNTYKDIYEIIYNHVVDANKPDFESWLKTIKFFDINHIYFGIYKACFNGTNSIPYTCPKCNKMFMVDTEIDKMVKYEKPEVKELVQKILARDTTTIEATNEVTLKQISDNYVVGLKDPSVYDVIFETTALSESFTEKYKDLLGIIAYIDGFYYIDAERNELVPVDTKPEPNNMVKTVMRKIKIYYEILSTLSSDQYYNLTGMIKQINDHGEVLSYILPEVSCPKCNHVIPEKVETPDTLLFTRHQLAAITNI